jgi:hypothetical protein
VILFCISVMISDVEDFHVVLDHAYCLKKCHFLSFAQFELGSVFLLLGCRSSLYILYVNCLSDI